MARAAELLDSQLVSVTVNGTPYTPTSPPITVAADHVFTVDITMLNTGTATWGRDRGAGEHGNTLLTRNPDYNTMFGTFLIVGGGAASGAQATYHSGLRAPSTPGDYTITWQAADWWPDDPDYLGLTYVGASFFGDTVTLHVTVTAPTPPPAVPAVPASTVSVSDFEYQGSFALPPVPGAAYGDAKHYTESGIALRTVGGEQRLLALTGTYDQSLYEVAIPTLGKIHGADTSAVPTATLRTYFGGLPVTSSGMYNGTIWYDQAGGLFYWENHANGYWAGWVPAPGTPVLRAATLDSGTLNQVQQWTQPAASGSGVSPAIFAGGVTSIPAGFASQYTGGRTLAFGFGGTFGPTLAAVSADPSGGDLNVLPIMYSAGDKHTVRDGNFFTTATYDQQPADPWTGRWQYDSNDSRAGVFIDLPDKKGYVTFVHQPINRISGDGFNGGNQNVWYVYDYATLGAAAAGGDANLAPLPSNYATVALPGDGTPVQQYITGSAFDPATRLLYVYARNGINHGGQPVVHVYKVRESAPTGVSGVPTTMTAGVPLTLTASIAGGTGQTVTWSVSPTDAGTTGAAVTGSTLTTTAAGTATVRATVRDGATGPVAYTQDFEITVNPASFGAKQITRFTVNGVDGVINQTTRQIIVTLPSGNAYLGSQTPTIAFTGASVTPASGVATDFSGPWYSSGVVTYIVTAQDGTTQPYQVVVGTDDARVYAPLSGGYTADGQSTVQSGSIGRMSFSASNFGLAAANDLALVLTLPPGITPDDLTVSYSGMPSTYDTATGWWRIPHLVGAGIHGNWLNGGASRLDITFAVPSDAKTGAHYVFTGQLINVNGQPLAPGQIGYNAPSTADFLVVASGEAWPLPAIDTSSWNTPGGNTHQYDAVLRTFGSAELAGVTALVPIPDGYTLVSATPTVGTYNPATGIWTVDSFTPDGNINHSPRLTMVVMASDPPPTSTALSLQITKVYGVAPDPALGTTVYMGLSEAPALRLTAQADTATAAPGDTVVHTLTLGTNTPTGVYGAKVAVTLPAHATLVSAVSPGGGAFDAATGIWSAAPFGSGVTSTLTLTYTVDAAAPDAAQVTTAAIAAAIPTLGFTNPASALVTTTVAAPAPVGPPAMTLAVVPTGTNIHTVVLTWTTPNDPANATGTGQPAAYDVRYSESPITEANFNAATRADMTIAPQYAGDTELLYVNALDTGKTYYFAARVLGTTGLVSAMSNVVSATTGPQPGVVDQVTVASKDELQAAINSAPPQGRIITVAAGSYEQQNTIIIQNHNNITIQGATGNPADTVFYGHGMNGDVIHNVWIDASSYVTIKNLTLRDSYYHGIQVNNGSHYFHADNLVVWDNGESAFKITAGQWGFRGTPQYSDYGLIENCHFGFTTNGVRDVIEGIDGIAVKGWVARNNIAENVRDISGNNYGYAMYFKANSIDSDFIGNTVINSDIGISFGDGGSGYTYFRYGDTRFEEQGGLIANNVIKSTSKDTGIVLLSASDFKIYNNTVWNTDAYFYNSISLRVSTTSVPAGYAPLQPTQNGEIKNNIFRFAIEPDYGTQVNQLANTIVKENNLAGGQSVATGLAPALFVNAAGGDFHLASTATQAIGQGANLYADVPTDFDGVARPATGAFDIGAYQFAAVAPPPSFVVPTPYADPQTPDEVFFNMRLQYFLPETEPLIKQTFGSTLRFDDTAFWEYASYYSRAVGFATNLPTLAKIEYGPTTAYGQSTDQTESYYYQHLFYLTGLEPGQTYHYRVNVMGSDGAVLTSDDKVFTTPVLPSSVIRIPQDLPGQSAPYHLATEGATYVLTTDLTVPNGGFVIDASGVTLDLGGHTVTYDNDPNPTITGNTTRSDLMYSMTATFGVRTGLWNLTNQKIVNGRLVQGTNGGAGINGTGYNPVYAGATMQLEVAGITADYYGDNINGIDIGMENNSIHHNVVYDRGTGIDLRDIQMRAITTYQPDPTSVTAYNSIRRSRQVGIAVGGQQIGNEVYDDSYSTNSFLLSYASNSVSENNKLFGLGYMPVGIGGGNMHDAVARNNFIYVVAYAPNQRSNEYDRLSAVVGFRPQVYPNDTINPGPYDNNLFENNVVVGKAVPGSVGVRALWVGSDPKQHNMVVRNNIVKVEALADNIRDQFSDPSYSFACVDFQGQDAAQPHPPVLFQNNTLITNMIFIAVGSGYGVGSSGYFYDTTFQKIDHNSGAYAPFRIGYWTWNSYGVKVIDSIAGPGVDLRAPVPNVAGDTGVHLSLDFGISSTRVYAAADGTPLANTTVTWQTDGGDQGSFTTDGDGQASNEWMTTHNLHAVGDPGGTMTQVQNTTITFTVAGYDPVTKNLADVQKTGPAVRFGNSAGSPDAELTGLTIAGGSLVRPSAFDGRRTVYWVKPAAPSGGTVTVTASAPAGMSVTYTLDGVAQTGNVFTVSLSPSKLMSEIGITVSSGSQSKHYYLDVAVQDPTSYQVAKQYYPDLKQYNATAAQTRVLVDQFAGGTTSANELGFIATYLEGSQKNTSEITGPVLAQNPLWHSLHYHLAIWNNPDAAIIWNDQWSLAEWDQLQALAASDPNVFMYAVDKQTGTLTTVRDTAYGAYLMNIANDTYYNWLLANIIDQCQTDHYDSVFLDSYNMDTVYSFTGGKYVHYDGTDLATYQDPQLGGLTWAQASEEFMARLTRDLNRAGIWALPNLGNQRTTWDPVDYAYSNGGMFEDAPETPTAAHGDWQQDMSRYIYLAEKGKVLIFQNYSPANLNDVATRLYVTAAYQMARAGYTYVNQMVGGQAQASWYPEYGIGAMLGAATQTVTGVPDVFSQAAVDPLVQQYAIGNNLYERRFQNGLVVINADAGGAAHDFTVPDDGRSYVSVTIQPGSGGTVPAAGGIGALTGAPNYPLVETPVSPGQVITLAGDGALILVSATSTPQPQQLSFASGSVTKVYGDAQFTNALTHVGAGAVTYTSSDPTVATVAATGLVTIVGAGTTTITATAAAVPGQWNAATASYTLIVTVPDTTAPTVINVTPSGAGAAISGNIVITFSEAMNTAAGTVQLNGAALTGGTWSSGDTVFTIAYSGLAYATSYTVNISGFNDVAGNTMADDSSHSFTTMTAPDTTPPTVTNVAPSGTGAAISGSVAITFSEPMNTAAGTVQLNGATLTGGTWSSGDTVFTIAYSGLAYATSYTVNVSGFKDVAGNTMAADSSHGFTTMATPDTTPPMVSNVTPSGTGAAISGSVVITFSEPMNTAVGTVQLNGAALTGGTWSNGDTMFTIAYSGLAYATAYTVSISGFKDVAGNTMVANSSHSFTTMIAPDTTPPTVTNVAPSGTGAAISGSVVITFDEAMDTAASGTVELNGATLSGGSWSSGDTVFTIAYSGLAYGTSYTVNIADFNDVAGNTMAADSSHGFTTMTALDTTPPTVSNVTPSGTGAAISGSVVITFSEPMNTAAGTVQLNGLPALAGGTWSSGDTVFTIAYSGLSYGTSYTVNISNFKDVAGNTMSADSSHSFTTATAPDTTPPTVTNVTPSGTDAPISGNIAITFSEPMNTTAGTVQLNGAALTGGTWSSGDTVFTVAYSGLAYATTYTVNISGFKDVAGNTMALDNSHGFMTQAAAFVRIASADLTLPMPVAGAAPAATAGGCGTRFTCDIAWSPSDDPFQAGVQYTVEITLTALGGETFEPGLVVHINGQNASVDVAAGGATAVVRLTFLPAQYPSAAAPIPALDPAALAALAALLLALGAGVWRRR